MRLISRRTYRHIPGDHILHGFVPYLFEALEGRLVERSETIIEKHPDYPTDGA